MMLKLIWWHVLFVPLSVLCNVLHNYKQIKVDFSRVHIKIKLIDNATKILTTTQISPII